MMICLFGFCFPVYQLIPVIVIILKTQWAWIVATYHRLIGRVEKDTNQSTAPASSDNNAREVTVVTDDDAFRRLLKENTFLLVDFQAEWCAPCKKIAPAIKKLGHPLLSNSHNKQ